MVMVKANTFARTVVGGRLLLPHLALNNAIMRSSTTPARHRFLSLLAQRHFTPQPLAQRTPSSSKAAAASPARLSLLRPVSTPTLARRLYGDDAAPPQPRRVRRVLRWVWRLTYLSALGGLGFLAWQIYTLRYPIEQAEPDPNKKTLVILGA
jgi:NADH:ubiquinone reductase (non-electrogenic)